MTDFGTDIRDGRVARSMQEPRAPALNPAAAETVLVDTPYWLLWSTGTIALVLCALAFVLWGINGASTLFDMIVALCT